MRLRMTGVMALSVALAMLSSGALAHGMQGGNMQQQPGQAMGPGGMMSQGGMGPGMIGPGMMGPGMMGSGMMGSGMMGHGMMAHGSMMGPCMMNQHGQMPMTGPMMGWRGNQPLAEDLSLDNVRHMMEHRVAMMQNPNLKLGEVVERDGDSITADVVTQDGSLVRRFVVDRHSGAMWPADTEQ